MATDVLTAEKFTVLMDYLANPSAGRPEWAESFMTTLNLVYMNRINDGAATVRPRNRALQAAASRLSLSHILSEAAEEDRRRETDRAESARNASRETRMAALESEARPIVPAAGTPAAPAPLPQMGQERLPLPNEEGFLEAGVDSVEIAKAIAWHHAQLPLSVTEGRRLTMSLLQGILYTVYGTYLAERNTRLTSEHPQMWQYGPIFPRVYSKMRGGSAADKVAAEANLMKDPVLSEFIQKITRICSMRRPRDLSQELTAKSSPWGKCNALNPEKWSTVIEDRLIAPWFRKKIDRSRQH